MLHGDNTVKIQGKNLLQITTFNGGITTKSGNGVTATINSDGSITLTGTASANINWYFTKNDFASLIKGNFYYLCNAPSANCRIELACKVDGTTKYLNDYGTGNKQNATTSFEFNSLTLIVTSGTATNVTLKPMVALGTTVTEWTPYITPTTQLLSLGNIELAKIGTYTDRIFKDSGKWYVEKNIGKLVLNGSETGWAEISSSIPFRCSLNDLVLTASNTTKPVIISNYFPVDAWNSNTSYPNYFLSCTTNEKYLRFRNTDMLNLNSFKTWLTTHNTKVYYATTTPTTTEITDTTLLGQLEELLKKRTNKNVTNISIVPTGTNAEPTAEVEYRQDLQTVIGNIQTAILSL